jgi:hypothetical protein
LRRARARCDHAAVSDGYARLVSAAEADDRIVGLLLGGSRGKGLATARSDYDVYVVVADGVDPAAVSPAAAEPAVDYERDGIDLVGVWTVSAFAAYGIGDGNDWNRYNFAHLTPTVDKLGVLTDLCAAKERLADSAARSKAAALLDGYLNYRFRAAKNHRDGNVEATVLDVAESVPFLLDFAFTTERRVRPYNKFLEWELRGHPLEQDWGVAIRPETLRELVRTADPELQAACFRAVASVARAVGHGDVLDSWRPSELALMGSSDA